MLAVLLLSAAFGCASTLQPPQVRVATTAVPSSRCCCPSAAGSQRPLVGRSGISFRLRSPRPPLLLAAPTLDRWRPTRRSLSVAALLFAAFLNLLGFTMAGPITPALGHHFGMDVGASLGMLTSAYPLGMLGGLVLWPALSDRVGRTGAGGRCRGCAVGRL